MIEIYPKSSYPISGYKRYQIGVSGLEVTEDHNESRVEISETTISNPDSPEVFLADKWASNYWHWHFDVFPPALFLDHFDRSMMEKVFVISPTSENTHFRKWWFNKLGIKKIRVGKEESRSGLGVVEFDWRHAGSPNPRVLEMIRSKVGALKRDRDLNILIQRKYPTPGPRESRNIENRDEVSDLFEKSGRPLKTVFLEDVTMDDQISLFNRSRLVIGVHGAGLTNLTFCQPGTVAVEIESPLASHCMYLRIASFLGIKSASILGEITKLHSNFFHQSLWVNPVRLLELVELLEK